MAALGNSHIHYAFSQLIHHGHEPDIRTFPSSLPLSLAHRGHFCHIIMIAVSSETKLVLNVHYFIILFIPQEIGITVSIIEQAKLKLLMWLVMWTGL